MNAKSVPGGVDHDDAGVIGLARHDPGRISGLDIPNYRGMSKPNGCYSTTLLSG
jgi:hypothetical protein